jgi:hypothetical protein
MNWREEEIVKKALAIAGASETLIALPRMCSRHGQPYVAMYRLDNGFWRFKECRKLEGTGAGVAQNIEIDRDKMTGNDDERCPWCGTNSKPLGGGDTLFCLCGRCKQYVCMGASTDKEFRCAPQCGNRSKRLTPIEETTRLASLIPRALSLGAGDRKQLSAPNCASLPAPSRYRLTSGKR